MLNALGLGILFQAKDEARDVVEKLEHALHGVHKAAEGAHSGVLSALGGISTIVAGTAVAIAAIGTGAAFEFAEHAEKFSGAIRRAGVASHATAEEMHMLEEVASRKGMDSLIGSSITAAEALRELALEGFNARQASEALDGTLMLMRISMGALTPTGAAGIVNDTLAQFGMEASQAGELTDKLAFAMKNFGFRAEELRPTMAGLAAGAQLTGASLDDTLVAVGLVKQVFPSATKAAMSMNTAMNQLAGKSAQKELAGIGVSVTDTTGKIRPLIDIITQLSNKTANMTEGQRASKLALIAGGRAAGGLSAIIEGLNKGITNSEGTLLKGADAAKYLKEQIAASSGTAKKMATILGDDMGGAIFAMKNALSNAGVEIGKVFEEPFKNIFNNVNLFVRGLTQLFTQGGFSGEVKDALDQHLGIKSFVIQIFGWAKRIENFFTNVRDSFESAFAPFKPTLDLLLETFGALGAALGFTSQTANDNASAFDRFGSAGATVGSTLANLAGAVLPIVTTGVALMIGAVELAKSAWESFGPVVTGVWNILSGVFKAVAGLFSADWKMLWDGFVEICAGAAKIVVTIIMGTIGWFAKLIDSVGSTFGKDFGLAKEIESVKNDWTGALVEGTSVIKSVVSPNQASPAGAAIQGQAAATAAATAPLMSMAAGGDEQVTHHHVSVHLDGEKVGETLASSRRSLRARSFEPVTSAHEGSF